MQHSRCVQRCGETRETNRSWTSLGLGPGLKTGILTGDRQGEGLWPACREPRLVDQDGRKRRFPYRWVLASPLPHCDLRPERAVLFVWGKPCVSDVGFTASSGAAWHLCSMPALRILTEMLKPRLLSRLRMRCTPSQLLRSSGQRSRSLYVRARKIDTIKVQ